MPTASEQRSTRSPYLFVLQTGLITTALALGGVYWLNGHSDEFQIMGWYADYVIPVGAIIVGAAAGSGYGIASWFTGVRISRKLLVGVLLLQAGAYVAAEYVEYRDVMSRIAQRRPDLAEAGVLPSFPRYYDIKARSFQWKAERAGEKTEPLGGWGYFFLLLGATGFIASGLIAPAVLMAVPYCESCQRYMSSKVLGVLPASVPPRKIAKGDAAAQKAYEEEQMQAGSAADGALSRLREAATAGNPDAFKSEIAASGNRKANEKLPRRIQVSLAWCKACNAGQIAPTVLLGQGNKVQRTKMEKTPVPAEFVRPLLGQAAS